MEHYSLEKWADFALQVIREQERAEMQNHLDIDGCRNCSKLLGLWQRVQVAARNEQSYQPPDSVVRSMKGAFALHGPRRATRGVHAIVEVLFDSARNPLPAGVRSVGTVPRQLLYGIGDYRVDLRIDPQGETGKADVAGQVLNSVEPSRVQALRVALLSDRKVVSESVTGQFGEFQLIADRSGRFHLRVDLPGREVSLPAIQPTPKDIDETSHSSDFTRLKKAHRRSRKRTKGKT
jgi:hypothetical protein